MKIWQAGVVIAIALLSSIYGLGCFGDCGEANPVESGEYVIPNRHLGVLNWLDQAQMNIDRAAEIATLRYTREGTTYEVRFTLTQR